MSNVFDQFDSVPSSGNVFDQFDVVPDAQIKSQYPESDLMHLRSAVDAPIFTPQDDYIQRLMHLENANLANIPDDRLIRPNVAPELQGGADIGFGHKLTPEEIQSGIVHGIPYKEGFTIKDAKDVLVKDTIRHWENARRIIGPEVFDALPQESKILLTDYSFTGVLDQFPKFRNALIEGDYEKALEEYERNMRGSDGELVPLGERNEWAQDMLNRLIAQSSPTELPTEFPDKAVTSAADAGTSSVGDIFWNFMVGKGQPRTVGEIARQANPIGIAEGLGTIGSGMMSFIPATAVGAGEVLKGLLAGDPKAGLASARTEMDKVMEAYTPMPETPGGQRIAEYGAKPFELAHEGIGSTVETLGGDEKDVAAATAAFDIALGAFPFAKAYGKGAAKQWKFTRNPTPDEIAKVAERVKEKVPNVEPDIVDKAVQEAINEAIKEPDAPITRPEANVVSNQFIVDRLIDEAEARPWGSKRREFYVRAANKVADWKDIEVTKEMWKDISETRGKVRKKIEGLIKERDERSKFAGTEEARVEPEPVVKPEVESPELVKRSGIFYHRSSNPESIKAGIEQRDLGFSVGRTPDEMLSSPRLEEPKTGKQDFSINIEGNGLDYSIPAHKKFIDDIFESFVETGKGPYDVNTIKTLRDLGIQFVDNWNGIGKGKELHVLDPSIIKSSREIWNKPEYAKVTPEAKPPSAGVPTTKIATDLYGVEEPKVDFPAELVSEIKDKVKQKELDVRAASGTEYASDVKPLSAKEAAKLEVQQRIEKARLNKFKERALGQEYADVQKNPFDFFDEMEMLREPTLEEPTMAQLKESEAFLKQALEELEAAEAAEAPNTFENMSKAAEAFAKFRKDKAEAINATLPRDLYHGSRSQEIVGDFKITEHGDFGEGVYLTPDKAFAEQFTTTEPFGISPTKSGVKGKIFEVLHDVDPKEIFIGDDTKLTKQEKRFWEKSGEMVEATTRKELMEDFSGRNFFGTSGPSGTWTEFFKKFGYKAAWDGNLQFVVLDPKNVKLKKDAMLKKSTQQSPKSETSITPKDLELLDDDLKLFDTVEEAQAYKELTGKEGDIITDPISKKSYIEFDLKLMEETKWEDMSNWGKEEATLRGEDLFGDEVPDYELSDTGLKSLWNILNNERGSVSTTELRALNEKMKALEGQAKRIGKSVEELLDGLGVEAPTKEQILEAIRLIPQRDAELRSKESHIENILNPGSGETVVYKGFNKFGEGKNAKKSARPPVTKRHIAALIGAKKFKTPGKIGSGLDLFEIPINTFERFSPELKTILYDTWTQARTAAKKEYRQFRRELARDIKGLSPEDIWNISVVAHSRQKGGRKALASMGITDIPEILPLKHEALLKKYAGILEDTWYRNNYIRSHVGLKTMGKVDNYFPLIHKLREMERAGIISDMAQIEAAQYAMQSNKFRESYFPYANTRRGANLPIELDIFKLTRDYMSKSIDAIHINPVAALAKELANYQVGGKMGFKVKNINPELAKFLNKWADNILGVDPTYANFRKNYPGWARTIEAAQRNVTIATLFGTLSTAIKQTTALIGAYAETSLLDVAYGAAKAASRDPLKIKKTSDAYTKSNVLDLRSMDIFFDDLANNIAEGRWQQFKQKAANAAAMPMQIFDAITAEISWNASHRYAQKRLGLEGADAIQWADDVVTRTQGLGIKGGVSPIQSNMMTKWATLFQTFAINDYNYVARELVGIRNPDISRPRQVKRVLKYVAATAAFNTLFDYLGMEPPKPAPVREYKEAKEEGLNDIEALSQASMELIEILPMIGGAVKYESNLLGPMGEFAADIPQSAKATWELANWGEMTTKQKFNNLMLIGETLGKMYGIPMTNQIKKSIRTASRTDDPLKIVLGIYVEEKRKAKKGITGSIPKIKMPKVSVPAAAELNN